MDGDLFGKKSNPPSESSANIDDVMSIIRDIMRRLRQLEERHANMRKTLLVNEQNMLKSNKKNSTDVKTIEADLTEMKKMMRSMGEEVKHIIREMGDSVKREDVRVLEKYISFWQPLHFVTHNELEKEVKKIVKREVAEAKALKE